MSFSRLLKNLHCDISWHGAKGLSVIPVEYISTQLMLTPFYWCNIMITSKTWMDARSKYWIAVILVQK